MDLAEIGISAENWVDLAQDRYYWRSLVNSALNLRVPLAIELYMYNACSYLLFFPYYVLFCL